MRILNCVKYLPAHLPLERLVVSTATNVMCAVEKGGGAVAAAVPGLYLTFWVRCRWGRVVVVVVVGRHFEEFEELMVGLV